MAIKRCVAHSCNCKLLLCLGVNYILLATHSKNQWNQCSKKFIKMKVSMCRDIIADSNITKAYVINTCDFDVNTPLNAIHVQVYSNYVISF